MKNPQIPKLLFVFSHGKESGPSGGKIRHLADIAKRMGAEVISPDYSDLADASPRVERLLNVTLLLHEVLILVGSSMGGYVSTVASRQRKPDGLFLMAPAFGLAGYAERRPAPHPCDIEIVMGWQDEVIAPAQVIDWAQQHHARLHLLPADHRLNTALEEVGEHFQRFLHRVLSQKSSAANGEADAIVEG